MSKLEEIEDQIKTLTPEELTELRGWFQEYDAKAWDEQFERDVKEGKLDRVADQALRDHAAGRSTKL
ncbi:MAG: hypothetical protein DMG21_11520 [Acidobacteria bacterium]|nr:MAG: hypothetical protein DMG21_11520 [Acidobacteriota bacterium]